MTYETGVVYQSGAPSPNTVLPYIEQKTERNTAHPEIAEETNRISSALALIAALDSIDPKESVAMANAVQP